MTLPVRSPSRSAARWDPFRELDELYERMNALWQSGLGDALEHWSPLADVEETDDAYTVELDLPGVAREDVDIQLDDRQLTVSGHIEEKERQGILHRRTRRVGRFHYSVTLPGEVDADGVSAQLHDGVLTVRVPKSAQAKPRRIAITT
jgi:HSP20 family protein